MSAAGAATGSGSTQYDEQGVAFSKEDLVAKEIADQQEKSILDGMARREREEREDAQAVEGARRAKMAQQQAAHERWEEEQHGALSAGQFVDQFVVCIAVLMPLVFLLRYAYVRRVLKTRV